MPQKDWENYLERDVRIRVRINTDEATRPWPGSRVGAESNGDPASASPGPARDRDLLGRPADDRIDPRHGRSRHRQCRIVAPAAMPRTCLQSHPASACLHVCSDAQILDSHISSMDRSIIPSGHAAETRRSGIEDGAPVGLFDRLTRKPTSFQSRQASRTLYVDYDFSLGLFQWTSGNEPVEPPTDATWYGPGEEVEVAGFSLPGGMIYVGQYLPSPTGLIEPSLIVPTRRVNRKNPDRTGQYMHSWPTYGSMARTSRGAYLEWLAEGRRNPSTSAAYALLFMAGLERRVLVDIAEDDALTGELPAIRAEMVALLDTYGDRDYLLQTRATEFVNLIDLMTDDLSKDDVGEPPPLVARTWVVPPGLRIGLGRFAARKQPIPAEWALAWGWYNPEIPQRAPMTRCTDAFSRLFPIRYRERFGDGLVVRPGKRGVTFYYRPAIGPRTSQSSAARWSWMASPTCSITRGRGESSRSSSRE